MHGARHPEGGTWHWKERKQKTVDEGGRVLWAHQAVGPKLFIFEPVQHIKKNPLQSCAVCACCLHLIVTAGFRPDVHLLHFATFQIPLEPIKALWNVLGAVELGGRNLHAMCGHDCILEFYNEASQLGRVRDRVVATPQYCRDAMQKPHVLATLGQLSRRLEHISNKRAYHNYCIHCPLAKRLQGRARLTESGSKESLRQKGLVASIFQISMPHVEPAQHVGLVIELQFSQSVRESIARILRDPARCVKDMEPVLVLVHRWAKVYPAVRVKHNPAR